MRQTSSIRKYIMNLTFILFCAGKGGSKLKCAAKLNKEYELFEVNRASNIHIIQKAYHTFSS